MSWWSMQEDKGNQFVVIINRQELMMSWDNAITLKQDRFQISVTKQDLKTVIKRILLKWCKKLKLFLCIWFLEYYFYF